MKITFSEGKCIRMFISIAMSITELAASLLVCSDRSQIQRNTARCQVTFKLTHFQI